MFSGDDAGRRLRSVSHVLIAFHALESKKLVFQGDFSLLYFQSTNNVEEQ